MAAEGAMTVIAMTREIGSHGSEVAAGVAAELGLEIINSEIVVPHIAGSLGLEHSSVQRYVDGKATLFDRWQIDTRKVADLGATVKPPQPQSGAPNSGA
jgi:cytidylate kinase